MKNAHRISARKPEGKRVLGKLGIVWEDNIKIDLRKIKWL
jgi:hypothetical protein